MCGRYTLYLPWSEIHRLYNLTLMSDQARNTQPRYNICPTQDVLFVTHSDEGMKLREGRWGLVPFWAKELGNFSTFNAMSEEADKKQCSERLSRASGAQSRPMAFMSGRRMQKTAVVTLGTSICQSIRRFPSLDYGQLMRLSGSQAERWFGKSGQRR